MISVITAIHNQLAVNKLFLKKLRQYTKHPFELIIVDNNSTDGSREFFKSEGVTVIENDGNYSYPYCQNQGIKAAKYDVFAFLNNDIIVAPEWDEKFIRVMEARQLEIITCCGVERIESKRKTKALRLRWNLIKNGIGILGINGFTLQLMHKLMYGDWELFCENRFRKFKDNVVEGFVGNSVIMKRSAIDKVGMWDESIQGADFDLYVRSKKRSIEHHDIKPIHIALGIFHHHFIRLTTHSKPPEFKDKNKLIRFEDKWEGVVDLKDYLKDYVEN